MTVALLLPVVLAGLAAAAVTAGLIVVLRPVLVRNALARPNARSSHKVPTPQGAGIAVVAGWLTALMIAGFSLGYFAADLALIVAAVMALATVGLVDDLKPLPPVPKLGVQAVAALALVMALPLHARALPMIPLIAERAIEVVGLVWFVNLTNFMDGIDGMTVAGVVPPLVGTALLANADWPLVITVALVGALTGFAPFNRHVAKVFLGDVGSLAVGGITGWLLLDLACSGRLAPALILPLYYLADTGLTLARRWCRGERVWQAHREHCYQRALTNGRTVPQVVAVVWSLNALLLVIALATAATGSLAAQVTGLALAGAAVALALRWMQSRAAD